MDVFDRVGAQVNSAMSARFARSPGRKKLRPHFVRAYACDPRRSFLLGDRMCHAHIDLQACAPSAVHEALADAIQSRLHREGFSWLGRNCTQFGNVLMRALDDVAAEAAQRERLSTVDERKSSTAKAPRRPFRPLTLLRGQTSLCRFQSNLGTYLRARGYDEAAASLEGQETTAAPSRWRRLVAVFVL